MSLSLKNYKMTKSTLIKNASIVNENTTFLGDVLIENEIIKEIAAEIKATENVEVIDEVKL